MALFEIDGDVLVPTPFARGPWSPDALHGGPVAALLARALEALPAPGPMHPARLTVELLRPVPLAPLAVRAEVIRPGRKVQLADAVLSSGGTELARARLLRIRSERVELPGDAVRAAAAPPPFPAPAGRAPSRAPSRGEHVAFHSHATEHVVVRGTWGEPGPIVDWIRLREPVIAGETASPLQRVAAVADFGNGVGSAVSFERYSFINPDLSIHLHRLPRGEWVCLEASTLAAEDGVALAESALWDERGRIGRSLQGVLLERR